MAALPVLSSSCCTGDPTSDGWKEIVDLPVLSSTETNTRSGRPRSWLDIQLPSTRNSAKQLCGCLHRAATDLSEIEAEQRAITHDHCAIDGNVAHVARLGGVGDLRPWTAGGNRVHRRDVDGDHITAF